MSRAAGVDARIAVLAAHQAGAFSRQQVLSVSGTPDLIRHRLATGRWRRTPQRGVYLLAGAPPHADRPYWLALLAAGTGRLSHEAAGRLHGLEGFRVDPGVVLSVPHPRHLRLPGIVVHQIGDHRSWHLAKIRRMPITTPARTVLDLAGTKVGQRRLRSAVQSLLVTRRVQAWQLSQVLADVARPGKPGVRRLGLMLDELVSEAAVAESVLEARLLAALREHGVPLPRWQAPHPGRLPGPGRVDGLYEPEQLILEADGRRWHARLEATLADRRRDQEASRVGYATLRILYEQLADDPRGVCRLVADTLDMRRRQLGLPHSRQ